MKKIDFEEAKRAYLPDILERAGFALKEKKGNNSWLYTSEATPRLISVWQNANGVWMFKAYADNKAGTVIDLAELINVGDSKRKFDWLRKNLSGVEAFPTHAIKAIETDAITLKKQQRSINEIVANAAKDVTSYSRFIAGEHDIPVYLQARNIFFIDKQFTNSVLSNNTNSVAFPFFDQDMNIVGYETRHMHTSRKFYTKSGPAGVFISRDFRDAPPISHIYVFESAIEALSHHSLFQVCEKSFEDLSSIYLALRSGSEKKTAQIIAQIASLAKSHNVRTTVELNFNNDAAGCGYFQKMFAEIPSSTDIDIQIIMQLPFEKKNDWNDVLDPSVGVLNAIEAKHHYADYRRRIMNSP